MTKKKLMAKLEALEDNGIISGLFIYTLGLDDDVRITDRGKRAVCYRNYYCNVRVPETIQSYIDKGYMEQEKEDGQEDYLYFRVTEKGFAWLSKLLGIKVEDEY